MFAFIKNCFIASGLGFFLFVFNADSAVLALWENDHLAGNEASTTAGENPSGGSWNSYLDSAPVLGRGPGATAATYQDAFAMRNANETTLANAISNNRYWTFTLTPGDKANWMNITNITIRFSAQDATNYEVFFLLMSDQTGFTDGDELATWAVGDTGNVSGWLGQQRTVSLSSVSSLQQLTNSVEFRVYAYGQPSQFTQVGIGWIFKTDGAADLTVFGEMAVLPEPSAMGLIGFACMIAALRKKRNARSSIP